MGIKSWFKGKLENRASATDMDFWQQFFSIVQLSASGKSITPDTAMAQSTVFACVKILSETMASLPLFLYRRKQDGSKSPATNKSLFSILHTQPNPVWSVFEFKEYLTASVLLRGNAFCWREVNKAGELMALWPLDTNAMAWKVGVNKKGARVIAEYNYTVPETGEKVVFAPSEIWHLKDMIGDDGVSGMSRISQCKDTIGLSLSADEYGAKFFANDATPAGILSVPGVLNEDARKAMVKSWNEIHKGSSKAFKTGLMEGGAKFESLTMKNEDAQFIETRSFQVADICRIFKVPTIMVSGAGDADKSNTYASAEQQMLSFVQNTIRPWAVRIETNISTNLLDEKERKSLFAEFKLEGLLRGDFKTRMEGYRVGREIGLFSVDEIRNLENLDPLGKEAGGEDHIMPMNFKKLNEETVEPTEDEPDEPDQPDEEIDDGE
jgi:HK97 family phage portal protein